MKWVGHTIAVFLLVLLPACARRTDSQVEQLPVAARAVSPLGTLEVALARTEMSTVDRLELRLMLAVRGGVAADELQFRPQDAGWTVVASSTDGPELGTDGLVRTTWAMTLEPFLDGTYEIPPASIELHDAHTAFTLMTPAQSVTVSSVLKDGQDELAPARTPVEIADEHDASSTLPVALLASGAAVGCLAAGAWLMRVRRRRSDALRSGPPLDTSPRGHVRQTREELIRLLTEWLGPIPPGSDTDQILALARGRLDRALLQRVHHMLRDIDRLMYGPEEPCPQDIERLDRDLKRLAEVDREEHA
ncbi:MAG: hypothetical protein Kow0022_13670 [Phycisphaerales bacterium]